MNNRNEVNKLKIMSCWIFVVVAIALGIRNVSDNNIDNNIVCGTHTQEPSKNVDKKPRKIFRPPTIQEVREYCLERGNDIDAEYFVNFYQSKNWMVGKNKMKDWRACVRTWEIKNRQNQKQRAAPNNNFHNFEGRDYDYAAIEERLAGGR